MENDGEAGELLLDLMEHVESEWGRNELAGLWIAGALLGLELVSAVAGADRDSEGVATCACSEVDHFLRLGVVANLRGNLILYASEHTQLTLYGNIVLVGIFNYLTRDLDILLVGERRAVEHYR